MRQHVVIGAVLLVGLEAQAAPVLLGEDELRLAVTGKTVSIDTPLGLPITVNYGANGIMTGTVGAALGVYLGAQKDRGRWSIKNGKLCQKWFKWLDAEMNCLTIRQDGLAIHWQSDQGKSGTATIEPGPPVLAGASASGLGLPPPVAPIRERASVTDVPSDEAQGRAETVAPAKPVGPPSARPGSTGSSSRAVEKGTERVEGAARRVAEPPVVDGSSAAAPVGDRGDNRAPATDDSAPALVEVPAPAPTAPQLPAIRLLKVKSAMAPVLLASLGPPRGAELPAPSPIEVGPSTGGADPFEGDIQPMRSAADLATIGALQHRWCLGNALGRGPALPAHMALDPAAAAMAIDAPSLLAIVQEQAYEGDLPLYEPACLTPEPAIGVVAKLASSTR